MSERFQDLDIPAENPASVPELIPPPVVRPPATPPRMSPPPAPRSRFLSDGLSGPNRARVGLDTAEEDFSVTGKFTWRHIVTDNPGIAASWYTVRRMFGFRRPPTALTTIPGNPYAARAADTRSRRPQVAMVSGAVVAALLFLGFYSAEVPYDAMNLAYFVGALGISGIASLFSLHSSIAGERERRSWDMLMTTPLSKVQIIASRLSLYVSTLLLLLVGFTFVTFAAYVFRAMRLPYEWWPHHQAMPASFVANFLASAILMLGSAWFMGTLAVFVSSRSRRAFGAFGTYFGLLFGIYLVLPVLYSAMSSTIAAHNPFLLVSPFYVLTELWTSTTGGVLNSPNPMFMSPLAATILGLVHFGLGGLLFYFASVGLTRADNVAVTNAKGASRRA